MTPDDLLELAQAFHQATMEDLEGEKTVEHVLRATRRSQQRLDQLFTAMTEDDRVHVACCAGCSWCCHFRVEVRAHDIFSLVAWIEENFTADARAALVERAKAHAAKLAGLPMDEQLRVNHPCPMLVGGLCTGYAGRPSTCRIAHSQDPKPCEHAFHHPEELDAPSGADMEFRLGMRCANDGVAYAFRDSGLDTELYLLSAGILEALTDQSALPRWLGGGRAFSDKALSRPGPSAPAN